MKRYLDKHNNFGPIWSATTRNFRVTFYTEPSGERYDGEDEGGEIQAALDSGEMVIFDSKIVVEIRDDSETEIGWDYLGSSVYRSGEVHKFLHDGYFRDMLTEACRQARETLANAPKLRRVA